MNRLQLAWELSRGRTAWIRPLYAFHNLHYSRDWLYRMIFRRAYRLARKLDGAKSVQLADLNGTCGSYSTGNVEIEFSGACPVQGEGDMAGYPCYYRSRGEGWQFYVAAKPDGDPLDDDAFCYHENCYAFPDGGWVSAEVSAACIDRGIKAWMEARKK